MINKSFTSGTVALAMGLAMLAAPNKLESQQMPTGRFDITLANPVTLGNKTLQPGTYRVQPMTISGGDAPVLSISDENGTKVETTAMIAPTVENRIQPETRVLLRHVGDRYYFDKIWVKGLAYGYRFTLPKGAKGSGSERR